MKKALVIAPHPDDETLGLGGTIARMSSAGINVSVVTVAAHMPPLYTEDVHETTVRESRAAQKVLGVHESVFMDKPAVFLKNGGCFLNIDRIVKRSIRLFHKLETVTAFPIAPDS
jgi:LmbE family N-acetylglucosaminyl deacetylase